MLPKSRRVSDLNARRCVCSAWNQPLHAGALRVTAMTRELPSVLAMCLKRYVSFRSTG
jgi:hypothetical protein